MVFYPQTVNSLHKIELILTKIIFIFMTCKKKTEIFEMLHIQIKILIPSVRT